MNVPSIKADVSTPLSVTFPRGNVSRDDVVSAGNRLLDDIKNANVRELAQDTLEVASDSINNVKMPSGRTPVNVLTDEALQGIINNVEQEAGLPATVIGQAKKAKGYGKYIALGVAVLAAAGLAVKHFVIDKKQAQGQEKAGLNTAA